jgi:hypothetical protein
MKSTLLAIFLLTFASLHAADDPRLSRVAAADDERVAAMIAADRARLDAIFSDDLHYAHSSGTVDTKASLAETIVSGRTKYEVIKFETRNFTFPAPGIALMSGRAQVKVANAKGGMDAALSFLAVWREEKGRWRFLAWQSCKLPAPEPAAK